MLYTEDNEHRYSIVSFSPIAHSFQQIASVACYAKDNGIGFDSRFEERVYVIFQRLHNNSEYSGTGIGLSICKKIVERHDGKILAVSEKGKGSTFYVSITK